MKYLLFSSLLFSSLLFSSLALATDEISAKLQCINAVEGTFRIDATFDRYNVNGGHKFFDNGTLYRSTESGLLFVSPSGATLYPFPTQEQSNRNTDKMKPYISPYESRETTNYMILQPPGSKEFLYIRNRHSDRKNPFQVQGVTEELPEDVFVTQPQEYDQEKAIALLDGEIRDLLGRAGKEEMKKHFDVELEMAFKPLGMEQKPSRKIPQVDMAPIIKNCPEEFRAEVKAATSAIVNFNSSIQMRSSNYRVPYASELDTSRSKQHIDDIKKIQRGLLRTQQLK